jgi:hypothetical protein
MIRATIAVPRCFWADANALVTASTVSFGAPAVRR